jgi:hypothetical protein
MDILEHAISFAQQIGPHAFKASAITRQKCRVVPSFRDEGMNQREQYGGVGIGTDRNPLRRGCVGAVFTNRTDADDLDARAGEFHHPAASGMLAAAALRHLQVLGISATEQHEELRVTGDRRPRC